MFKEFENIRYDNYNGKPNTYADFLLERLEDRGFYSFDNLLFQLNDNDDKSLMIEENKFFQIVKYGFEYLKDYFKTGRIIISLNFSDEEINFYGVDDDVIFILCQQKTTELIRQLYKEGNIMTTLGVCVRIRSLNDTVTASSNELTSKLAKSKIFYEFKDYVDNYTGGFFLNSILERNNNQNSNKNTLFDRLYDICFGDELNVKPGAFKMLYLFFGIKKGYNLKNNNDIRLCINDVMGYLSPYLLNGLICMNITQYKNLNNYKLKYCITKYMLISNPNKIKSLVDVIYNEFVNNIKDFDEILEETVTIGGCGSRFWNSNCIIEAYNYYKINTPTKLQIKIIDVYDIQNSSDFCVLKFETNGKIYYADYEIGNNRKPLIGDVFLVSLKIFGQIKKDNTITKSQIDGIIFNEDGNIFYEGKKFIGDKAFRSICNVKGIITHSNDYFINCDGIVISLERTCKENLNIFCHEKIIEGILTINEIY